MHPSSALVAAAMVTGALTAAACGAGDATGPDMDDAGTPLEHHRAEPLVVMTRNIYVGADVDAVIAALATPDPSDDLPTIGAALATLERTDFPVRAAAIAAEIARARPHVVALQEVSRVAVDLAPLGLPVRYDADFLPVLLQELTVRGLDYVAAGSVENIVAQPLPGVELRDYDVVLVDADRVAVDRAHGRAFAHNIGVVAPGVEIKRGYVLVEARIGGDAVTFVGTHLESGPGAQLAALRGVQAQELVLALAQASRAVLLGDLNDLSGSPMHQVLSGAALIDAWAAMRPGAAGLTCCHAYDLGGAQQFSERIDYVLARGFGLEAPGSGGRAAIIGERPSDRVSGATGPIWPSDHAGLAVSLP